MAKSDHGGGAVKEAYMACCSLATLPNVVIISSSRNGDPIMRAWSRNASGTSTSRIKHSNSHCAWSEFWSERKGGSGVTSCCVPGLCCACGSGRSSLNHSSSRRWLCIESDGKYNAGTHVWVYMCHAHRTKQRHITFARPAIAVLFSRSLRSFHPVCIC